MKKILLLSFVLLFSVALKAQIVYNVDRENQSDIRVFIEKNEKNADLKVYEVSSKRKAKGNEGLWFFSKKDKKIEKRIFFVENEYDSNLKVFIVNKKRKSGWINNQKKYLMY